MKIHLIITALFTFSAQSFAGEVNNGGGFSEQNFVFAYSNLERFLTPCLSTETCKVSSSERKTLEGIKDALKEERAKNPYPLFKSGIRNEFDFYIDGDLRAQVFF